MPQTVNMPYIILKNLPVPVWMSPFLDTDPIML
jgi:hypothetical protein